jgi:predicted nucleic acid-binding protein
MTAVDASVVVDWMTTPVDAHTPAQRLRAEFGRTEERLVAPRLLLEECLNAFLTRIRRRQWSTAAADSAARSLTELPIEIVDIGRDRERAWELARRYDNHPHYDMVYVALAERLGDRLVTADRRLIDRLGHLDWVVGPEEVLAGS